jgi:hypothetical protein
MKRCTRIVPKIDQPAPPRCPRTLGAARVPPLINEVIKMIKSVLTEVCPRPPDSQKKAEK